MKIGTQQRKSDLRTAIKDKCIECMGGPEQEGFRTFIAECTSCTCPLHDYRPYTNGHDSEEG